MSTNILAAAAAVMAVGSIAYITVREVRRHKAIEEFKKDPTQSTDGLKKAFGIPPDQPWPGLWELGYSDGI